MLTDAAFGAIPGVWPLPEPRDGWQSWHRAIALGGQGRYAAARAETRRARELAGHAPDLVAATLVAEASWLRQLGWHTIAARRDGAALRIVPRHPDALIGLAADALGAGRLPLARRLLSQAPPSDGWRTAIRWAWVRAEVELAAGASGATGECCGASGATGECCGASGATGECCGASGAALGFADEAVARSAAAPSVRHRVKSALLRAAALSLVDPDSARVETAAVAAECHAHGLLPLRWAAAMLAGDTTQADRCGTAIAQRGGLFRQDGQTGVDVECGPQPISDYCGTRSVAGRKHVRSGCVPLVTPGNR